MTDEIKKPEPVNIVYEDENEIDLLELAGVIWKGKNLVILIIVIFTFATAVMSLFMTNIYTATAVIKPVTTKEGGGGLFSLASQFGGMASLAGIAMPTSASATELVSLLKSNILKKNIIERYNLLSILFPKKPGAEKKEAGISDTWDGIRALDKLVKINYNLKDDIITITVNFRDPDMAAAIANYFIVALNEHMSSEAKRIAGINKTYLEKQLQETNDNIVQQKIYNLIAEKIETMMMAEVKENFAFKVLDPPMAPDRKSKPKRAQMVVIAFIVSLFFGVFVVFFREYLKKIKTRSAGGHHAQ